MRTRIVGLLIFGSSTLGAICMLISTEFEASLDEVIWHGLIMSFHGFNLATILGIHLLYAKSIADMSSNRKKMSLNSRSTHSCESGDSHGKGPIALSPNKPSKSKH